MRYCIGILAIFCLLVSVVGAASECGPCVFSAASSRNECPACVFASDPEEVKCPACVFASDPEEVKCPACVFGDPASLNGCSACEFSIHVAGDGYSTYQVSGNHIQFTMVYQSPSAALFVPDAVSRGYMGYDPADLPSRSTRQQYFAEAAGLSQRPGNQQVADRFERIFSTSSGFSQFL
jgi:hypothetical protein